MPLQEGEDRELGDLGGGTGGKRVRKLENYVQELGRLAAASDSLSEEHTCSCKLAWYHYSASSVAMVPCELARACVLFGSTVSRVLQSQHLLGARMGGHSGG